MSPPPPTPSSPLRLLLLAALTLAACHPPPVDPFIPPAPDHLRTLAQEAPAGRDVIDTLGGRDVVDWKCFPLDAPGAVDVTLELSPRGGEPSEVLVRVEDGLGAAAEAHLDEGGPTARVPLRAGGEAVWVGVWLLGGAADYRVRVDPP